MVDPLQKLWNDLFVRKPKPKPEPHPLEKKYYFDAGRFRWLFGTPAGLKFLSQVPTTNFAWSLETTRNLIDAAMEESRRA